MIDIETSRLVAFAILLLSCFKWWQLEFQLAKVKKAAKAKNYKQVIEKLRDFDGFGKIYRN